METFAITSIILDKIVSGGQTGTDQAALDAALNVGFKIGGWCPRGRRCENGIIPIEYPLKETPSGKYEQRTEWNVKDSDGTLIITDNDFSGGTAYTLDRVREYNRPKVIIDLHKQVDLDLFFDWLKNYSILTLNIAGPRESRSPGIYHSAYEFLTHAFGQFVKGIKY